MRQVIRSNNGNKTGATSGLGGRRTEGATVDPEMGCLDVPPSYVPWSMAFGLMAICLIGLGSNLGDRTGNLAKAVDALGALPSTQLVSHSDTVETDPVGGPVGQTSFLNAAALVQSALPPHELLLSLQGIEDTLRRTRDEPWGPRPIDLDLLLYGDRVLYTDRLVVPHPWFTVRRFALQPAAEIAPEMCHPLLEKPLVEILQHLDSAPPVVLLIRDADNHPSGVDRKHLDGCAKIDRCEGFVSAGSTIGLNPRQVAKYCEIAAAVAEEMTVVEAACISTPISEPVHRQELISLNKLKPPPRILVGLVEPSVEFSPWQPMPADGMDGIIAENIVGAGLPFVMIARGETAASQIAAAVAATS